MRQPIYCDNLCFKLHDHSEDAMPYVTYTDPARALYEKSWAQSKSFLLTIFAVLTGSCLENSSPAPNAAPKAWCALSPIKSLLFFGATFLAPRFIMIHSWNTTILSIIDGHGGNGQEHSRIVLEAFLLARMRPPAGGRAGI